MDATLSSELQLCSSAGVIIIFWALLKTHELLLQHSFLLCPCLVLFSSGGFSSLGIVNLYNDNYDQISHLLNISSALK